MPMYEYVCGACGHYREVLQKVSDTPLVHCEHCQQNALERLVSQAGFRLKGEGWYETDFKGGENKRNLVDAPESTPAAASDSSEPTKIEKKAVKETSALKAVAKTD